MELLMIPSHKHRIKTFLLRSNYWLLLLHFHYILLTKLLFFSEINPVPPNSWIQFWNSVISSKIIWSFISCLACRMQNGIVMRQVTFTNIHLWRINFTKLLGDRLPLPTFIYEELILQNNSNAIIVTSLHESSW